MSAGTKDKYCVIGAGVAGLAVAKTFRQRRIPFDLLEREADLGGLWNIATGSGVVYESTHLVSAKQSTGFEDFPMPEANYPDYPSHAEVLTYFREYAEHFGVVPHIQFAKPVRRITPLGDGSWQVMVQGEREPRVYRGVVLANGHHSEPRTPCYPGTFAGDIMHSRDYRSVHELRDKRVLVVGAGNSACDIIRDAAHGSGAKVVMSMRRGTWFVPKYLLGWPTHEGVEAIEMLPVPRIVKRWIFQASLWLLQGPPARYGLPAPKHPIDAAHPTMSDDIPRLAAHGRIKVRPEIARFEGEDVVFVDGTRDAIDLIVFATGYRVTFPFLADDIAFDAAGRPKFYLNTLHKEHGSLFAAGLIQANGSIWRLADYQGQLIANTIVAQAVAPAVTWRLDELKRGDDNGIPGGYFVASDRHRLEANYFDYLRILRRHIRAFGKIRDLGWIGADERKPVSDQAPAQTSVRIARRAALW